MAVYLNVAPPAGFESWTEREWDEWRSEHPLDSVDPLVADKGDWAIFLFQVRRFAPKAALRLDKNLELLITEKPLPASAVGEVAAIFRQIREELRRVDLAQLSNVATQFYTPRALEALAAPVQARKGPAISAADLWESIFELVDQVSAQALEARRGLYFGEG